jgi:alpha-glucosidase (family GH31 glycosyl hydrolase)
VGVERVRFSVPGESLEYFQIYGPTPKEVLSRYTALTGRPALPPPWPFGLWLTPGPRQVFQFGYPSIAQVSNP